MCQKFRFRYGRPSSKNTGTEFSVSFKSSLIYLLCVLRGDCLALTLAWQLRSLSKRPPPKVSEEHTPSVGLAKTLNFKALLPTALPFCFWFRLFCHLRLYQVSKGRCLCVACCVCSVESSILSFSKAWFMTFKSSSSQEWQMNRGSGKDARNSSGNVFSGEACTCRSQTNPRSDHFSIVPLPGPLSQKQFKKNKLRLILGYFWDGKYK